MAVANNKWNFVFLAEPHTGSRAVSKALLTIEGSYKVGSHHIPIETLLQRNYLKRRKRSLYTTIATVRNPADILVTKWLQTPETNRESFADYIRLIGFKKPDPFFFMHADKADRVIRYENLESELNQVLHSLKAPYVRLEIVGQTSDKEPWFRYYTPGDLWFLLTSYPEIARWRYTTAIQKQIDAKSKKTS